MTKRPAEETTEEVELTMDDKMNMILVYLRRMDKRDRLRTIGGFIRGALALIPLALLLWSAWYFYKNGDKFIEQITEQAVQQSAEYSQDSLMKQLEKYMQQ